jgi:membrane protease YdiL (CAAX protease family)
MPIPHRHRIVLFLILTSALSSIFYIQIAATGKMKMLPVLGLMWCPGAAAMVVRALSQGNLQGMGWEWRDARLHFLSYLLPVVLGGLVYGLVWVTGIGGFAADGLALGKEVGRPLPLPAVLFVLATLGMLHSMFFALGEEIGWRGFLVPELAKVTSFARTGWISGAAWAVYHYPLILFADYHSGTTKWFALGAFTWMVVASAFVYAWLRLKSGSLWTAVILHASHNLFIQSIFDPLTTDRTITKYVTTEFGVGLALAYTLAAVYVWRRRDEAA